jgi:hypothetical protein
MKTAVEWLIETHFGSIENCTPDFRNKIKQAIKMEKNQIIEAFYNGCFNTDGGWRAEQYYNEIFKKDEPH